MNAYQTPDGRLDQTVLVMALQELEAGTLDPFWRNELMALVNRSPAAQRAYLEYFEVSAMLGAEAATYAEQGNLPKIIRFVPPAHIFRRSLLAAALLTLGAVVAALIHVARPEVPELALAAAADTLWSVQGEVKDVGANRAMVREGSTVLVDSGTMELHLESGASMVMQGPAQVSFPKLTQPVLRKGWLWIDSGTSHESFEVRTPDLRIRNQGTRFGVRAPAEGPAELHLIKGELEAISEATVHRSSRVAVQHADKGHDFPGAGRHVPGNGPAADLGGEVHTFQSGTVAAAEQLISDPGGRHRGIVPKPQRPGPEVERWIDKVAFDVSQTWHGSGGDAQYADQGKHRP
jgi:ferric-dicitrate binding protein FerR (iron transport regulator)